jgi:hypothetical protein
MDVTSDAMPSPLGDAQFLSLKAPPAWHFCNNSNLM